MPKIRVLIVDDSALIRNLLTRIINSQHDMEAIGTAPDPMVARDMIKAQNPDVLTLDIEMPKMDGLEFLEKIMRLRPMPVLMVSTLTEKGCDITMRALELGAVDFVTKPKLDITAGLTAYADEIAEKIRAAHLARGRIMRQAQVNKAIAKQEAPGVMPAMGLSNRFAATEKLIFIGASTGGTEAIRQILERLPVDSPAILITQHMPVGFTKSFADRLNQVCQITVKEATHGERVLPGHAYIAPGDKHLLLSKSGANYICALSDDEPVNRHRPSVEVLFDSGARHAGKNIVGIMLTGMGKDGAVAMKRMRDAGSYNICQDEASCVVFGMPKEAINAGAAHEIVGLDFIATRLMDHLLEIGGRAAIRV
ncbi:MAG: chemotaxis response regulator protein-glutamate methylesterase [Burkholderiales bacterium]|nr:chemotaxis response regulator protein-glutamate methylesterase [Burkholderiales bacterium]